MNFSATIGICGVLLIMVTYFLLQIERMKSTDLLYSVVNFVGGAMILVSLMYEWNLASFLMEVVWCLISLFGIVKAVAKPKTAS
jgi:hypothetical protein